jgi:allantoinase
VNFDTLIRNGSVVTESGIHPLHIAVTDGRITALLTDEQLANSTATETIDAAGQYVIPGAIDIHFHCRAPAYPERGDFASETRAAAAGGVTTIFEMPISKPCCATGDIFRSRRELGQANAYVNFALYGAPGLLDPREIEAMVKEGAIGFKIFMTAAPAGRDDEFVGLCLPNPSEYYQALQLVAPTGLVTVIHAENNELMEWHMAQLAAQGRNDYKVHGDSRPPHVEALAIAEILSVNDGIGAKIHIAHVSCEAALNMIRRWQKSGSQVTGETCPHYLFFTEDDLARVGPYGKINPPLRQASDQAALWEGLLDGSLIAVTTDHSPFTAAEKERTRSDIWRTPPGAPGVEQLVLGVMDAALNGRLSIEKAVSLISANGAKRFGIYPRKGVLREGADADIVLYDPRETTTIRKEALFTRARECDWLYDGKSFRGRIARTIVGGRTVFVDGEIVGQPGWGAFVRPEHTR